MSRGRQIITHEVSEEAFDAFLASHPELTQHGATWVERVKASQHTLWLKPMAYVMKGKFYTIEEVA